MMKTKNLYSVKILKKSNFKIFSPLITKSLQILLSNHNKIYNSILLKNQLIFQEYQNNMGNFHLPTCIPKYNIQSTIAY